MDDVFRYIKLYETEVLKKVFPNAGIARSQSISNDNAPADNAHAWLSGLNQVYKETLYYYEGELLFIHYTSLKNLINILNERTIKLFDFTNLNDPQELIFASTQFIPTLKEDIKNNPDHFKQQVLSFSFCNYNLENNQEQFDMWRFYGLDGLGVGMVFSIKDTNRSDWYNFLLSKVYYKDEYLQCLEKFTSLHTDFVSRNKFKINNPHDFVLPLFGLHKKSFFKTENEVRLIKFVPGISDEKYQSNYINGDRISITTNQQLRTSFYYSLPILLDFEIEKYLEKNKSWPQYEAVRSPYIKIEEIILGYRYTDDQIEVLKSSIADIFYKKFRMPIKITESKFKKELFH